MLKIIWGECVRTMYSTANDPQPQIIPRPQMIPKMDRKLSSQARIQDFEMGGAIFVIME